MSQHDLFGSDAAPSKDAPLAARMRPRTFDEFVGQEHLTAPNAAFRKAVEADRMGSIIFWGPPGVGKTTLAEIIANATNSKFERISAVSAGVADLRRVVESAKLQRRNGHKTTLFIDEIHRFNKSQQDAILPVVEDGTVTLIGATTENPLFEVNAALISRSRVYVLNALTDDEIKLVVDQALQDKERGLGNHEVELTDEAKQAIATLANGDARTSLNLLELCTPAAEGKTVDADLVREVAQRKIVMYDKGGEQHFDLISALHKSVRGSDVDASLYWLGRMLEAGEEPNYLARRIVRMASEDIGLADPQALILCMAAQQAVHFIGMPEGGLALAEAVAYLAAAPKSNALYKAYRRVQDDIKDTRNDPVPLHLRNSPTELMKNLGYGKGYKYAHDFEEGVVYQQNLPDAIKDNVYYKPTDRGYELRIQERLKAIRDKWAQADKSKYE